MANTAFLIQRSDSSFAQHLNIKLKLLHKGDDYMQYSVIGHQTINQAFIPAEINVGEMFKVRNVDGSSSIAVWLGTLLDSLRILQFR